MKSIEIKNAIISKYVSYLPTADLKNHSFSFKWYNLKFSGFNHAELKSADFLILMKKNTVNIEQQIAYFVVLYFRNCENFVLLKLRQICVFCV